MIATSIISPSSIISAKAAVNTQNLTVFKSDGHTSLITSGGTGSWVMTDEPNIIVGGEFQTDTGNASARTATITIPDTYVWDNPTSGSNYTINIVDTHTMEITFLAPANPSQPETIGFSFKAKLDQSSVSDAHWTAMQTGAWDINGNNGQDNNTKFTFEMNDDGSTVTDTATFTFKDAPTPSVSMVYYHCGAHGQLDGKRPRVAFSGVNPYTTGPVAVSQISYTLPTYFKFKQTPTFSWGTAVLSPDSKTVTVTVTDPSFDFSSADMTMGSVIVEDQYVNIQNQNPSGLLPSGIYPLSATFSYAGGYIADKTVTSSADNYDNTYTLTETGKIDVSGTPDIADGNKLVLQSISSGQTNVDYATPGYGSGYIYRNPEDLNKKEPLNDGTGYSATVSFDSSIKVKSFKMSNPNKAVQINDTWIPSVVVNSVVYYTNLNPTGTVATVDANGGADVSPSLASGEYITGYKVTYDKLIYTGVGPSSLLSSFKYDGPTGNAGDKFPINYTLNNASNDQVATATNYIMIEKEKCPTWDFSQKSTIDSNANQTTLSTSGNYTDGSNAAAQITMWIKDAELGGTTGIKTSVENPTIYFGSYNDPPAGYDINKTWYWDGKIALQPVMGDGKWSVSFATNTAQDIYDGGGATVPAVTHTVDIPAFATATTVDLYTLGGLSADDVITGNVTLHHDGVWDLSSIAANGTDKTILSITRKNTTDLLLEGLIQGDTQKGNGAKEEDLYEYRASIAYDDCTCIAQNHLSTGDKTKWTSYYCGTTANSWTYGQKGAEIIAPSQTRMSTGTSAFKQGSQTTITAEVTVVAADAPNAEYWTQGGETAYLKLADQNYVSFVPGTAKFDGVADPNASIVTINGVKYLKITNTSTTPVKKNVLSAEDSGHYSVYEPYKVSFDVYSLPTTPVTGKLAFTTPAGSWLDIASADTYNYGNQKGAIELYSGAFTYQGLKWAFGAKDYYSQSSTNFHVQMPIWDPSQKDSADVALWDDPLGLYTGTPITERNWALNIKQIAITPEVDAVQGITLNPGISNSYQNDYQTVKPAEEGSMTTAISIIAGTTDMSGLDSVIKIPRAGDTLTKYPGNTTTVSQYLTGPVVEVSGPGNGASAPVTFEYSTDGGATFVDEASISDWSAVTHIHVHNNLMKAQDTASYYLPLETENAKDNTGVGSAGTGTNAGKSYWEAVFTTDTLAAKSNRMNTYDYGHLSIAGTVFNDADNNGNYTSDDSAAKDVAVELWADVAGVSTKVGDKTTEADGTYSFSTDYYQNVIVKVVTPNGKKITVYSATTDNKFPEDKTGTVAVTPGVIPATLTADITGIDAGLVSGPLIVELEGIKTITGTGAAAKTYNFTMADGNASGTTGYTMPADLTASAANVAVGTPVDFKFNGIEITKTGTYTFTFTEDDLSTADKTAGYTKDGNTITATVVVGQADGEWTVNVTYAGGAGTKNNTFKNTYMVPEVTGHPAIIKSTDTTAATPGSYPNVTFTMADTTDYTATGAPEAAATMPATKTVAVQSASTDVTGQFEDITFTKTGTYTFSITETAGTGSGWTGSDAVTATATVSIASGALSVAWTYDNDDTITNTYAVTDATAGLTINKAAAGDTPKAYPTFTFSVAEGSGNDTSGYTMPATTTASVQAVATPAVATATFDDITFTKEGSYTFDITETTADANGWVGDGNTVTATVVVTDTAGALSANVTYSGGTGTDHNTITNTFTKVDATMSVTKHVAGQTPPSYPVFSFTLANTAGDTDGFTMPTSATTTVQSAVSDASGNFGAVSFYKAGTYTFTGTETTADSNGWVKSDSPVTYTVVVTDTNGTLAIDADASTLTGTITNTYTPGVVTQDPPIQKIITGGASPSEAAEFIFTMTGADGAPMPTAGTYTAADGTQTTTTYDAGSNTLTASHAGAGGVEFGNITYDTVGTYVYTLAEDNNGVAGYNYDDNTYTMTVTVTDNAGQLEKTVEYKDARNNTPTSMSFTNEYDPKTSIRITKVWIDNDNAEGIRPDEITVVLKQDDIIIKDNVVLSAANNWVAEWDGELPITAADGHDYVYTVEEPNVPDGYTCYVRPYFGDNNFYVMNYHGAEGSISVTKVWDDNNNRYKKRPDSVTVGLFNKDTNEQFGSDIVLMADASGAYTYTWNDVPMFATASDAEPIPSTPSDATPMDAMAAYDDDGILLDGIVGLGGSGADTDTPITWEVRELGTYADYELVSIVASADGKIWTVTNKCTYKPTSSSGGGGGNGGGSSTPAKQPSLNPTSGGSDAAQMYGLNPDGTPIGSIKTTGLPKTGDNERSRILMILIYGMMLTVFLMLLMTGKEKEAE